MVLTGAACWPSVNCIPAQKIVSLSTELNHNCSALVLDSDNGVWSSPLFIFYIRVLHTTASEPNLTCEVISPAAKHILPIMKKWYIYEKCVDLVECNISRKKTHYARCPALELFCNSLCGPLPKNLKKPDLYEFDRPAMSNPNGLLSQNCVTISKAAHWMTY